MAECNGEILKARCAKAATITDQQPPSIPDNIEDVIILPQQITERITHFVRPRLCEYYMRVTRYTRLPTHEMVTGATPQIEVEKATMRYLRAS